MLRPRSAKDILPAGQILDGARARSAATTTRAPHGSDFYSGIVGVGGIVQWRIVVKDGRIVEVMEVVGVKGSRVLVERYRPLHDTVL